MKLDPFNAPAQVPNRDLWHEGVAGEPKVGDLWLLSWDREGLGLIALTGIARDYILGWPVTLPAKPAFAPAIRVDSPLGNRVAIWPTRETGVGLHLLHRRYGQLLKPELIRGISAAVDHDEEPPLPYEPPPANVAEAVEQGDKMITHWEDICFNLWPRLDPGQTPLNRHVLTDLGIRPSDLMNNLGVTAIEAAALHKGVQAPTEEQIEKLAGDSGLEPEALVAPGVDEGTLLLLRPAWKEDVLKVAQERSMDEALTRKKIQEQYALAARSNGSPQDRMSAAISRVRSE